MSDASVSAVVRAIRFVGLCLFYGLYLQGKFSSESTKEMINQEYSKL